MSLAEAPPKRGARRGRALRSRAATALMSARTAAAPPSRWLPIARQSRRALRRTPLFCPMSHPIIPDLSAFQALAAFVAPGEEIVISICRRALDSAVAETALPAPVAVAVPTACAASDGNPTDDPATPLTRARQIAEATPDRAMNARSWAREIGYSERELGRARRAGAIPHQRRGLTRGHNGLQIAAADLVCYLELVGAIESGEEAAPRWYATVRRRR